MEYRSTIYPKTDLHDYAANIAALARGGEEDDVWLDNDITLVNGKNMAAIEDAHFCAEYPLLVRVRGPTARQTGERLSDYLAHLHPQEAD